MNWDQALHFERALLILDGWTFHLQPDGLDQWSHPILAPEPVKHELAIFRSRHAREVQGLAEVVEKATKEAWVIAKESPMGPERTAELRTLRDGLAERLAAKGFTEARAAEVVRFIQINVGVEETASEFPSVRA
jgi:hypothetical protein